MSSPDECLNRSFQSDLFLFPLTWFSLSVWLGPVVPLLLSLITPQVELPPPSWENHSFLCIHPSVTCQQRSPGGPAALPQPPLLSPEDGVIK